MSRARFHMLDGLRGIAALAVLLFHYGDDLFGHSVALKGYLAVDLFFILSGVVIAQAYDDRLAQGMTLKAFGWARFKRLYPVYAIGLLLGWVVSGGSAWALLQGAVFLPQHAPGSDDLYALNIVFWSLGLEVAANLLYGLCRRWASTPALLAMSAASAVVLAATAATNNWTINWGAFHGGWYVGPARVLFGFPLGVVLLRLFRQGRLPRPSADLTPAACAALAVVMLAAPGPLDLPLVLAGFPLLTVWAMQVEPSPAQARWFAALAWLSYPLYAVHEPIRKLFEAMGWSGWAMLLTAVGAAILTGWLERVIRKAPAALAGAAAFG